MHAESFYAYCAEKLGVEPCFPFDEKTLVFKVGGKMFALASLDTDNLRVNLKCDPDRALELRASWPGLIIPAWHMNKKHWNTVLFEENIPEGLLRVLIDHSYDLVWHSLTKKARAALK